MTLTPSARAEIQQARLTDSVTASLGEASADVTAGVGAAPGASCAGDEGASGPGAGAGNVEGAPPEARLWRDAAAALVGRRLRNTTARRQSEC